MTTSPQFYDFGKLINAHKIQSIIFKITDACNLQCSYCYRNINIEKNTSTMPLETIRKSFQSLKEEVVTNPIKYENRVYLVWHGGEPLMGGLNYFKEIIKMEQEIFTEGISVENAIQTNGTLIDDKWADFFQENNFSVGVSIDGYKEINDCNRCHKNGGSSFHETLKGIEKLKQRDIRWSAISVITNETYKKHNEIYSFFIGMETPVVDFIPCFYYDGNQTLSNEGYFLFLKNTFDLWFNDYLKNQTNTKVRFLSDILSKQLSILNRKPLQTVTCELAGLCGCNFSIAVNGEVSVCECLTPENWSYIGNINKTSFAEQLRSEEFISTLRRFNKLPEACSDCDVFTVCMGGCLNRRIYTEKDYYCEARKKIIDHIGHYAIKMAS